jgi:hypothetical protein
MSTPKNDMSVYISEFKLNDIKNDNIKYAIKGSLSLYLHYLAAKYDGEKWLDDDKPNDIDIDVFYRDDPIMNSDKCTDNCRRVIKSIIECLFANDIGREIDEEIDKKIDQEIDKKIDQVYAGENDVSLLEDGKRKVVMSFEKLDKRVMFGKVINEPYSRIMLQYYDTNGDNFIDFFIDSVTDEEFRDISKYIESIHIIDDIMGIKIDADVLTLDNIIDRYYAMYVNPSPDRLKKLPAARRRFQKFLENTNIGDRHKKKIKSLLEAFDGLEQKQSGGGRLYLNQLYHRNKAYYLSLNRE